MANSISFRTVATVLFMVVSTILVSLTVARQTASGRINHGQNDLRSVHDFFSKIVSPETAKVMAEDKHLKRSFLDVLEFTSGLTKRLAEKYDGIPQLQHASESVEKYRSILASDASVSKLPGRQLPNPFAGLDPTDPNGPVAMGMKSAVSSAFSSIGDSLLSDVGGAALFLGTGLGAGAAQGLNLASANMTAKVAAKVASNNGQQATGLNPAIMNLAMGASASVLGSVNVSSLAGSLGGGIDIKSVALSFAQGLGNGTSSGLQLSSRATALTAPPGNSTADIAGTFAFGLTKTVASNVNLSSMSLTGMFSNVNISQFTGGQAVSQIAVSLAEGIGNGVSSGLKFTQANLAPPQGNTVGDTLGAFGFGLTNSVASNINTTALLASGASNINFTQLMSKVNLGMTGMMFGAGLGGGAAAGLNLTNTLVDLPDPNSQEVPAVAGNFAFGLTRSFIGNVNATMLMQSASSSGTLSQLTQNLDIGSVAQGAAMGFIQGAGDAVNSMGGLQALINGTATMPMGTLPMNKMAFNDSVGGAATGFGMGLGGQGTIVGVQLLSQLNVTSLVQGFTSGSTGASTSTPATTAAAPSEAAPSNGTAAAKRSIHHPAEIIRRQAMAGAMIGPDNSFNLSLVINAGTISQLGQRVIDTLSCEGIGGIILLGLGLYESGTITLKTASGLNTTLIKQVLPAGVMRFTNGGNTYSIDGTIISNNIDNNLLGAASGVVVNGSPVITFAAFLVIHILLALLAFVLLAPLAITFDSVRNMLVRIRMQQVLIKLPTYVNLIWTFLMGPLALLSLVFGLLAGGSSGHFRTVHGVSTSRTPI